MKEVDKHLVIKFIRRECTPEESNQVMQWMHDDKFDQELMTEIEKDLKLRLHGDQIKDESLQHLFKEILIRDDLDRVEEQRKVRNLSRLSNSRSLGVFARIAAAIVFLFVATYFIAQKIEPFENPVTSAEKITKQNSKGRKSTIFLSDGSVVNLNADSRIEYYENFTDSSRVVYLQGEAFFDITEDKLRPFQVITKCLKVTALGTSFNVQSFNENPTDAVALATGKVEVQSINSEERIFLNPGQKVHFKKEIREFSSLKSFSAKAIFGWKDGILFFKKANMQTVINQLERWYGVKIRTKNYSPSWSYTGEFHNQSLKSVLESLSFSQNFKYKITDKEVIIRFE